MRLNSGNEAKFCNLPMQVTLSLDETVVPEGQLPTQVPLKRKDPGRQAVHCFWSTVDVILKLGILQAVHLAPQAARKTSIASC